MENKKKLKEPRKYVTYGIYYDPGKFKTPKTEPLNPPNKPRGGFWSSPTNSPLSWKEWCLSQDFRLDTLSFGTRFNVSPTAKVLTLSSTLDYLSLPPRYFTEMDFPFGRKILNYEELLKDGYQALHLTALGVVELEWSYRFPEGLRDYADFSRWDCETMLIFDPSILRDVKYFGSRHTLLKKDKKAHS